ncbi:ABC transporter substrate-binding protein [Pseudonocardia acaciae]|uniref:ABC transporter substrate-binding protein n=1 Tax=Pseudonocardia acaciae TaxID=551276 RepID=UPI00048C0A4B|nr:ABC transporter substrate-binding protein [Pseudonocardia acaciae]
MRTDRLRKSGLGVVLAVVVLAATACGGSAPPPAPSSPSPPALGSAAPLFAQLPDRVKNAGEIVVSNPLSNPPYAYLEADGTTLRGIAPDLSRALEPLLGVKFRWVNTPFPGLMPGLQAHKFDMIWGSISDNKEREKILDFVAYQKDGAILLVKSGNPNNIVGITSLCGKPASALSGSVQIALLNQQSSACAASGAPPVDVRIYQSVSDAELAVRSGTVTAFFAGLGAALYQVKTAGDGRVFETAGPLYDAQVYGAGFRKEDRELSAAVQAGIKRLVADGTYRKIFDQHGLGQAALSEPEITINGAKS